MDEDLPVKGSRWKNLSKILLEPTELLLIRRPHCGLPPRIAYGGPDIAQARYSTLDTDPPERVVDGSGAEV